MSIYITAFLIIYPQVEEVYMVVTFLTRLSITRIQDFNILDTKIKIKRSKNSLLNSFVFHNFLASPNTQYNLKKHQLSTLPHVLSLVSSLF